MPPRLRARAVAASPATLAQPGAAPPWCYASGGRGAGGVQCPRAPAGQQQHLRSAATPHSPGSRRHLLNTPAAPVWRLSRRQPVGVGGQADRVPARVAPGPGGTHRASSLPLATSSEVSRQHAMMIHPHRRLRGALRVLPATLALCAAMRVSVAAPAAAARAPWRRCPPASRAVRAQAAREYGGPTAADADTFQALRSAPSDKLEAALSAASAAGRLKEGVLEVALQQLQLARQDSAKGTEVAHLEALARLTGLALLRQSPPPAAALLSPLVEAARGGRQRRGAHAAAAPADCAPWLPRRRRAG